MKSWHLQGLGAGLDGLLLRDDRDLPRPGKREVLVRVHATSLNFREVSILKLGRYPLPVTPGAVALCDGAGEVVELGEGATRWQPGARVIASIFPHWMDGPFGPERAAQLGGSLDGMLAEYVVLPEDALVPAPSHLSYEEAACLPCAGATAWHALSGGLQPLRAGDDVLTLGSGGVSLFALQLAKAAGARVIATTSSDDKAGQLRELGADAVVNYRHTPEWGDEVRRLTGGRGAQHVVEVGGAGSFPQSLKAIAKGGNLAYVGFLAGDANTIDANAVFLSGAPLRPVAAGHRAHLAQVARIFEAHALRPPIARVFDFDEAARALAWYAEAQAFGKTVIRVNPAA
jgi:NADPH:quinone reductase-like Zn-dependent oxidoreductase